MLKRACFFYVIALVIPSLVSIFTSLYMSGSLGGGSWTPSVQRFGGAGAVSVGATGSTVVLGIVFRLLGSVSPILFGLSVICGLLSVVPAFVPPPDFEPFGADLQEPKTPRQSDSHPPAQ